MDRRLDEIDKRVLYHLVRDARGTSAPDIASEVNVSPGTIRNRIDQMEQDGVIRGYHADVDYERAEGLLTNQYRCTAPVGDHDGLVQQLLQIPGVVHVRETMAGTGDLQVKAVGANTEELTRIAEAMTGLGIHIEDQALVQREVFHPYHPYGPSEHHDMPSITDFTTLTGEAEVVELTVHEDAPIAGRSLSEANERGLLEDDILVVAIEREGDIITPHGTSTLRAGDIATVFARNGLDDRLKQTFVASDHASS